MTVLPVVARELRVASRRPWTYWGRLVAAAFGLGVSAWLLLVRGVLGGNYTGEPIFNVVAAIALGFCLLSGLLFSADSVSSEKRDGTLGLLFLTDLRGLDIALGKLAATSLGAFYGLLAVLPLLALSLLMGGVTIADFGRMVLVLVVTLFTSVTLGLLASVLTTDVRRSVGLVALFLVILSFGGPLCHAFVDWILGRFGAEPGVVEAWQRTGTYAATPFIGYYRSRATAYASGAGDYLKSVAFLGVTGLVALGLASWRLPRIWHDKPVDPRQSGWRGWLGRLRFPRAGQKEAHRRRILDLNAITWLSARHWMREWLVWLFLGGILVGVVVTASGLLGEEWWEPEVGLVLGLAFHVVLKVWTANEAPRQFLEDRQSGAMELLLSTSLTVDDFLRGRWLALRRQFLGPLVAVLILDVIFISLLDFSTVGSDLTELIWVALAAMVMLIVDWWAIAWDGLWTGLTLRARSSSSNVVARILVLPWIAWLTLIILFSAGEFPHRLRESLGLSDFWIFLGSWLALGGINSAFWGLRARHRLKTSFRERAGSRVRARQWFLPWSSRDSAAS